MPDAAFDRTSAAVNACANDIIVGFDREGIDTNVALAIAGCVVKTLLQRTEPKFRASFAAALLAAPDA